MNCKCEVIKDALSEIDIMLTNEQQHLFLQYYELLIKWNEVMNLTAITEFNEVVLKHFVDSLTISSVINMNEINSLIDIGTGAGFPGIPLKIVYPEMKITLLDSLNKRVKFLKDVIKELKLDDIEVIHGRAEELSRDNLYRERFDICASRAVANLSTLSEYCIPFVKIGGKFISYKSEKAAEELISAEHAISILGGKISFNREFLLPNTDMKRCLVGIEKMKSTNISYPRKAGLPAKEPLK